MLEVMSSKHRSLIWKFNSVQYLCSIEGTPVTSPTYWCRWRHSSPYHSSLRCSTRVAQRRSGSYSSCGLLGYQSCEKKNPQRIGYQIVHIGCYSGPGVVPLLVVVGVDGTFGHLVPPQTAPVVLIVIHIPLVIQASSRKVIDQTRTWKYDLTGE